MPTSPISHVICSSALIILIFTVQVYYSYVVDNIWAEMARRELKEITDYVSDTLANLYFLANSTNCDVTIEKNLNLPSDIRDSTYIVQIVFNETRSAQNIDAYLEGKSWISSNSWLLPGLRVDNQNQVIKSGDKAVVAGCIRNGTGVHVWIKQA